MVSSHEKLSVLPRPNKLLHFNSADGVPGLIGSSLTELNRFSPDIPICARSNVKRPIRRMTTVFVTTMFLPEIKAKKKIGMKLIP